MDRGKGLLSVWWVRLTFVALVALVLAALIGIWTFSAPPTSPVIGINAGATATPLSGRQLLLTPPTPACVAPPNAKNPIVAENRCPGSNSWRQAPLTIGPANAINAFPVPDSVNIGETVHLYVSTTAHTYTFSVYRLGWYQDHSARLLYTSPNILGINQPVPLFDATTRTISCANWHDPIGLKIPTSWVSGAYIVRFATSDGHVRYTIFVVRNDASHAPVLYQMAFVTYQAYNLYGGRSLYYRADPTYPRGKDVAGRAYAVSFDRPYQTENGLGDFPGHEEAWIRFMERMGYNMSYIADTDLLLHPQTLTQHKLLIVGGHDEYWSAGMRTTATAALAHGVSLAFFFGNSVYWQTRMSDSPLGPDRIITCYKSANLDPLAKSDPSAVTVHWANPPVNKPQNSLLGEQYIGIPVNPAPLTLAAGALPYLTGTHLGVGSSVPGLVGGEIDGYVKNGSQPAHVTILASSPVMCKEFNVLQTSNATLYTAPSGAMVFDTGNFSWFLALDTPWTGKYKAYFADWSRFTMNILSELINAPRVIAPHV